jgi:monofunctional biosynthetic peptidoglycan transglycosylase
VQAYYYYKDIHMRGLIMISFTTLCFAACAINPSQQNTLVGVKESTMKEENVTKNTEVSNSEDYPIEEQELPGTMLYDFSTGSETWYSVDDTVMGGVSSSGGQILDSGILLFEGTMSLENNGGFSSIRSPWEPIDLSNSEGLIIRVLGDGQIYRLRVRTTPTGRDVAYNSFFETLDGEWTTVYIPFETMVPTLRGFQVNSGELDRSQISSLGFMLSDKQEGAFSLQVDWIRAGSEGDIFP